MIVARIVAKIGTEKPRAVTSVTGVMVRAVKKQSMAAALMIARNPCNPARSVLKGSRPKRIIQGIMISMPNRLRKKAI